MATTKMNEKQKLEKKPAKKGTKLQLCILIALIDFRERKITHTQK